MKKARLIKEIQQETAMGYVAEQGVYELSAPLNGNKYILVSAARTSDHGPETYIFGCDKDGNVSDWGQLRGSYVGGLSHIKALSGAGYEMENV